MKVVHISTTDYGGAYRAAANISRAMNMCGVSSSVLVREKHSDEDVIPVCDTFGKLFLSKAKNLFNLLCSRGEIVNDVFGTDITGCPEVQQADVIILHWINSFISYSEVAKLCSMGKPVFWVMHDMWCFTGGCHLDYGCGRYSEKCGKCPILHSVQENDMTERIFRNKLKIWNGADITAVGPSRYMAECASHSEIFRNKQIINIANPVDTDIFRREEYDKNETDKKTVMFGALKPGEIWKGMDMLAEALGHLDKDKYKVLTAGKTENIERLNIPLDAVNAGMVSEQKKMAELYSKADVYVIPSRQENLSNSVLEAMSCGIPTVAFDIGGMSDMIEHKRNGYLAKPFDTEDIACGIEYCAAHKDELGKYARQKTENEFSMKVIGDKYARLCTGACEHNNNNL